MGKKDVRSKIIDLLINKAAVKQDVADFSEGILELFKKAVKNDDLWKLLDVLASQHQIAWLWVKGHAGDVGNERADDLANAGVEQILNKTV